MELEWPEEALKPRFIDGLKPAVASDLKKQLAMATIGSALEGEETNIMERASLEQLITFACRIDDILFLTADRKEDRTWTPREPVQGRTGTISVPQEEKDRRSKEGICVKCGKGKHRFALCQTGWHYEKKEKPLKGKTAEVDSSESEKD